MGIHYRRFLLFAFVVGGLSLLSAGALAGNARACEKMYGKDDPADSPVAVVVSVTSADAEKGVRLRIEIRNVAAKPHTFAVCDSMTLCCVKDLHPLIGHGDTKMGLQDLCRKEKPTAHDVFLPAKATFAFDAAIPPGWLPESVLSGQDELRIQFCYDLGNKQTVHSNAVAVALQ